MADDDLGLPQEAVVLICVIASAFVICAGGHTYLDHTAKYSQAQGMLSTECFNQNFSRSEAGPRSLHLSSNTWPKCGKGIGRKYDLSGVL